MLRVLVFFLVLIFMMSFLFKFVKQSVGKEEISVQYEIPEASELEERYFIPSNSTGQLVHHRYYSLSYNEEYEQAEWVAYPLTKKSIQIPNVKRTDGFSADPAVLTHTLAPDDYRNTGYTKGHLVPAGDMAFNDEAMEESFLMSNASPQLESFNKGIWNQLEMQVRDWAYKFERLYVVTGPVLTPASSVINISSLHVPPAFYKVILDIDGKDQKGVGFIIPQNYDSNSIKDYMVSIDEVEDITGFNFYNTLIDQELQHQLESRFDPESWPVKNFKTFR